MPRGRTPTSSPARLTTASKPSIVTSDSMTASVIVACRECLRSRLLMRSPAACLSFTSTSTSMPNSRTDMLDLDAFPVTINSGRREDKALLRSNLSARPAAGVWSGVLLQRGLPILFPPDSGPNALNLPRGAAPRTTRSFPFPPGAVRHMSGSTGRDSNCFQRVVRTVESRPVGSVPATLSRFLLRSDAELIPQ